MKILHKNGDGSVFLYFKNRRQAFHPILKKLLRGDNKLTKRLRRTAFDQIELAVEGLFEHGRQKNGGAGKEDDHLHSSNLILTLNESFTNAIKKEHYPVMVSILKQGDSFFCKVSENGMFEDPKQVALPADFANQQNGRGIFLMYTLTGGRVTFEGKFGSLSFVYLAGRDEQREKLHDLTLKVPPGEPIAILKN